MVLTEYIHMKHQTQIYRQNIINKNKNVRENKKIVGVGETGLDHYNNSDKESQINSFLEHVN